MKPTSPECALCILWKIVEKYGLPDPLGIWLGLFHKWLYRGRGLEGTLFLNPPCIQFYKATHKIAHRTWREKDPPWIKFQFDCLPTPPYNYFWNSPYWQYPQDEDLYRVLHISLTGVGFSHHQDGIVRNILSQLWSFSSRWAHHQPRQGEYRESCFCIGWVSAYVNICIYCIT